MAAIPPSPICINGHWWEDVTDITASGATYSYRDVVACGGNIPWKVTVCGSSTHESPSESPKDKKKTKKEVPFKKFRKKRDWK